MNVVMTQVCTNSAQLCPQSLSKTTFADCCSIRTARLRLGTPSAEFLFGDYVVPAKFFNLPCGFSPGSDLPWQPLGQAARCPGWNHVSYFLQLELSNTWWKATTRVAVAGNPSVANHLSPVLFNVWLLQLSSVCQPVWHVWNADHSLRKSWSFDSKSTRSVRSDALCY